MYLSYGPYKHPPGECAIAIDRTTIENAAKIPIEVQETWTISGMLSSLMGPYDLEQQVGLADCGRVALHDVPGEGPAVASAPSAMAKTP